MSVAGFFSPFPKKNGRAAPHCNSQGRDQNIRLWDLAEGRTAVTDSVGTKSFGFCRCSLLEVAEGRWLLALPWKDLAEVGELTRKALAPAVFLQIASGASCTYLAPGQPNLFSQCQVRVLELPSKNSVCTLKPEPDAKLGLPMCLKLWQPNTGSHPFLLAGYENGSLALWNLSMGKTLSRLACHQEPIMSLDFDSEKGKGVSGSSEKQLCVWNPDEQQKLQLQNTISLTNPGVADVVLRQDRKILATGGWDYRVRLFGWKKLKPLAVLDYHTATVHCVAFSVHAQPRERLMAAASKDHRISVWSIYNPT
ncbi:hypothetical protein lerEdw1_003635 [Lerista edwardsae]|nr:hypothetical protein lerEdw1_003635 [Lerista edwardsae]